ncbi:MAG: putative bifunctional diguanylate cyclase/phosphodiesterase [Lachnospira sp.]
MENSGTLLDGLTGLPHRRSFWNDSVEYMRGIDGKCCLLTTDIEHFRVFNKWYGRDKGDKLLIAVADYLKELDKKYGTYSGYFGGDNFCIVFEYSDEMAETIRQGIINVIMNFDGAETFRPVFSGYIVDEDNDMSVGDMYDCTLSVIERIEDNEGSPIHWFKKETLDSKEEELKLINDVQTGIDRGEFVFYLQPKVHLETGTIVGSEALVRWIRPGQGVVSPAKFIPVLEKTRFITRLDQYIWEEVCKTVKYWYDKGLKPLPISINVSRIDIYDMDVCEFLVKLVEKYQIPASRIEVEITESAYTENETIIKDTEAALRASGFKVLIDDFGSGYSSLNMLKDIKADVLKLDMKFVDFDGENNEKGRDIIQAVLDMSKQIHIASIVEGVETEDMVSMLKDMGCRYAQGYYFYKPMTVEDFEKLLTDETKRGEVTDKYKNSDKSSFQELHEFREMFKNLDVGILHISKKDNSILLYNPCLIRLLGFDSFEEFKEQYDNVINNKECGNIDSIPVHNSAMDNIGDCDSMGCLIKDKSGSGKKILIRTRLIEIDKEQIIQCVVVNPEMFFG